MAHFDPSAKEVLAKIVYYGPPLAGKTTNLQTIYDSAPADQKGPLFPLATATGQTVFFDLLPPGLGPVHGMRMRCEICTVDGPISTQATLRAVLRDADAVVFVADSQAAAMDHNVACLESLEQILLAEHPETPLVFQYNKRDLPTALPIQVLSDLLNRRGVPAFQAIARQNVGVGEALRVILRRCFNSLAARDAASLSKAAPRRRPTARLIAADLPHAVQSGPEAGSTPPLRRATEHSQARGSLAGENRHLTIPAMPREAFTAAARRHDTVPVTPREFFGGSEDRHATLPAAPRETFGRPAPPAQDDEQTRPLRLTTEQSLARESLDTSQVVSRRRREPPGNEPRPEELPPPTNALAPQPSPERRAAPAPEEPASPAPPSRPKGG